MSVTTTTRTDANASAKKEAATAATTRRLRASLPASSGGTSGSGGGGGGSGDLLRTLGPRLLGSSRVCRRERRARSHSAAEEWWRRRRWGAPGATRHEAERKVRTGTIKSSLAARGTRAECTERSEWSRVELLGNAKSTEAREEWREKRSRSRWSTRTDMVRAERAAAAARVTRPPRGRRAAPRTHVYTRPRSHKERLQNILHIAR